MRHYKLFFMLQLFFSLFFPVSLTYALDNQKIFPIENYNQDINYWLPLNSSNINKYLLSPEYQSKRFNYLKHRYYGTADSDASPWSEMHIKSLITESPNILMVEKQFVSKFDNTLIKDTHKLGYALNKRLYKHDWIRKIASNMNLSQLAVIRYNKTKRAIAVNNMLVRLLPTDDPFYYSDKIAGEGYPFDNLQDSAIYTNTPLYVIAKTNDGRWSLVISPDIAGWVHSENVALVNDAFITRWQTTAYTQLASINQNERAVADADGSYLFTAYLGTLFPVINRSESALTVIVAVKSTQQTAGIKLITLPTNQLYLLPLSLTPSNLYRILQVMQGHVYGWGNLDMYNDCTSELKNIFSLFGIYIQRNTKNIDNAGKVTDLSALPVKKRMDYLMLYGSPLITLIHINGHVMLYIGKYTQSYLVGESSNKATYPLVYQQMWGLRNVGQSYRQIIGQSVFFPLLDSYKEDRSLIPENSFSVFRLIDLGHAPGTDYKPGLSELLY